MARTSSDRDGTARRRARGAIVTGLAISGAALVVVGGFTLQGNQPDTSVRRTAPSLSVTPSDASSEPVTHLGETTPTPDPAAGVPRLLTVPHLGIQAPVLRIRVRNDVLTPPEDAAKVGWDMGTAEVGAAYGSAVITGHTVHTGGGALNELDDLALGDTVSVSTDNGRIDYEVTDVTELTKRQMVREIPELFAGDVLGRLVLITCTDWNGVDYDSNIVVVAEPT